VSCATLSLVATTKTDVGESIGMVETARPDRHDRAAGRDGQDGKCRLCRLAEKLMPAW
jgi:hypothetical protein